MKKYLIVFTLLLFSLFLCFADEESSFIETGTSAPLTITAFKNTSLTSDYTLVVSASTPQTIRLQEDGTYQDETGAVGSVETLDISYYLKKNNTNKIQNAMTLTLSTNKRIPVNVDIWFSAFRKQTRYAVETEDGQITYQFDAVSSSFMTVTWTANSPVPAGWVNSDMVYTDGYWYRYKMGLSIGNTTMTTNSVSVQSKDQNGATMSLKFYPYAERSTSENGSYSSINPIPGEDYVLPGMSSEAIPPNEIPTLVSRSVNFTMQLASSFINIPTNSRYTGSVRITVKGD